MTAQATPRLRIEQACARLGRTEVIARSRALLQGGDVDDPSFVVLLGGAHALQLLAAGIPREQAYWLRVWAARGLLWAGPGEENVDALRAALADDSWRVREMTCKVVARHGVDDLLDDVIRLESADPVERVRAAAARAARRLVAGSAAGG